MKRSLRQFAKSLTKTATKVNLGAAAVIVEQLIELLQDKLKTTFSACLLDEVSNGVVRAREGVKYEGLWFGVREPGSPTALWRMCKGV